MVFLSYSLPLSTLYKSLMPGLLRSLSHPLILILVVWSHSLMYDFCQGPVIIDFCVAILSGRYSACLPNT